MGFPYIALEFLLRYMMIRSYDVNKRSFQNYVKSSIGKSLTTEILLLTAKHLLDGRRING